MTKQVKVFMEFVNYQEEVQETVEIATFRSIGWAADFLKALEDGLETKEGIRYRVEFDNKIEYIKKNDLNFFIRQLFAFQN